MIHISGSFLFEVEQRYRRQDSIVVRQYCTCYNMNRNDLNEMNSRYNQLHENLQVEVAAARAVGVIRES